MATCHRMTCDFGSYACANTVIILGVLEVKDVVFGFTVQAVQGLKGCVLLSFTRTAESPAVACEPESVRHVEPGLA